MKFFFKIFFLFISLNVLAQNNIGSGNCFDFSANINNSNHINLGSLAWINTNDFSVECWMKVNSVFDDEAFFSNKNWASGNNTGIVFDVQDNGTNMKFNFKDNVSPRKDLTVAVNVLNRDWFHFAGTFKRGGYFVVYINGQALDSVNVSSFNSSFASQYTYKLGQDGTGNYTYNGANPRYNGKIDELKIWSVVRTKQEIRDNMCHSLVGNETALFAYYNLNEQNGPFINDLSNNNNDANAVNGIPTNLVISGAPIGNQSVLKYGTSMAGDSLQLASNNFGSFKIDNFNAISGIHLYRVDSFPTLSGGLNTLAGNTCYFGAFICDNNNLSSYRSQYRYTNYTAAVLDESNLILFNRLKNDYSTWANSLSLQNFPNDNLSNLLNTSRREWMLGTTTGVNCQSTDSIYLVSSTPTSATVGWNSNFSYWNIAWGVQGFDIANGTIVNNTASNPYTFTNLASNVVYEMYVQDTCQGFFTGLWLGPFAFSGLQCLSPTQLNAIEITSNSAKLTWTNNVVSANLFSIEWGLAGFTQGVGIPVNNVSLPYVLNGLAATTAFDYYVKVNCGLNSSSAWAGPYTFTTLSNLGLEEAESNVTISPNPFTQDFVLTYPSAKDMTFRIIDALGRAVSFSQNFLNDNQVKISPITNKNQVLYLSINSKTYSRIIKLININ